MRQYSQSQHLIFLAIFSVLGWSITTWNVLRYLDSNSKDRSLSNLQQPETLSKRLEQALEEKRKQWEKEEQKLSTTLEHLQSTITAQAEELSKVQALLRETQGNTNPTTTKRKAILEKLHQIEVQLRVFKSKTSPIYTKRRARDKWTRVENILTILKHDVYNYRDFADGSSSDLSSMNGLTDFLKIHMNVTSLPHILTRDIEAPPTLHQDISTQNASLRVTEDYLNPFWEPNHDTDSVFCLPWSVNVDDWWMHHVEWEISAESAEGYCFQQIAVPEKRQMMQQLYELQFHAFQCGQEVLSKPLWSSGWGADLSSVIDGLLYGLDTRRPFQPIVLKPWHYAAAGHKGGKPVCRKASLECYFLPLSTCPPNSLDVFPNMFYRGEQPSFGSPVNWYAGLFATRPQTWVRHAVWELAQSVPLDPPCTVFHVRRGDVVLHDKFSRRYYAIHEYMDALDQANSDSDIPEFKPTADKNKNLTIFLLTDDQNAIEEAKTTYPQHRWVSIDRPRYHGNEGGFEHHIPSQDPKWEVLVLLTIFQLAPQCHTLVHTRSNLADYLAAQMTQVRGNLRRIDLNANSTFEEIYHRNHAQSVADG